MVLRVSFTFLLLASLWVHENYANLPNTIEPPPVDPGLCPVKRGEKGDTGAVGPAGPPGAPGVKGDQGVRGDKGDMGIQGRMGFKGSKGISGTDGKKGEEGKCDAQCGNVNKLENKLAALKANYTAELSDIKQQLAYLMSWIHPLGSKRNPATSCRAIKERNEKAPNGPYYIKVKDTKLEGDMQQVYCIMSPICPGLPGGLTQVMKIDGSKRTFKFSSRFWTNKEMFQTENGKRGCDNSQTKLATYWSVPFDGICLRMRQVRGGRTQSLNIHVKAKSLYDLIASGKYTKTKVKLTKWKTRLLRGASLQTACTRQGFNVKTATSSVRIGILGDNQSDFSSPDSYIGIGTEGSTCGRNPHTSAGNEAGCGADKGDQHIQARAFVYVY